jgi:hypothetical protein
VPLAVLASTLAALLSNKQMTFTWPSCSTHSSRFRAHPDQCMKAWAPAVCALLRTRGTQPHQLLPAPQEHVARRNAHPMHGTLANARACMGKLAPVVWPADLGSTRLCWACTLTCAATCSGVQPRLSTTFGSALPCVSSVSATSA